MTAPELRELLEGGAASVELIEDDDGQMVWVWVDPVYWEPVGETEGRELTLSEAIHIARYYGGGEGYTACESLGMAQALETLANALSVALCRLAEVDG